MKGTLTARGFMTWAILTTLCFQDATRDTYLDESLKIREFLLERGIIAHDLKLEEGHFAAGASAQDAVDHPFCRDLLWNHVEILTGRQIFSELEGAKFELRCRGCMLCHDGFKAPVIVILDGLTAGANESFTCPACGRVEILLHQSLVWSLEVRRNRHSWKTVVGMIHLERILWEDVLIKGPKSFLRIP